MPAADACRDQPAGEQGYDRTRGKGQRDGPGNRPCRAAADTPPTDTMAITASEVARMLRASRLVWLVSAGTITKPPPTPRRPLSVPDMAPVSAIARAQGKVQSSRLSVAATLQAGRTSPPTDAVVSWCLDWRSIRHAVHASTPENATIKGASGMRCASQIPKGASSMPVTPISVAAR